MIANPDRHTIRLENRSPVHDAVVVQGLLEMMRDGHAGPQEPPPSSHRDAKCEAQRRRDLIRYEDVPCPERCARPLRRDGVPGLWGDDR